MWSREVLHAIDEENERGARVILAGEYQGIQRTWAERWRKRHPDAARWDLPEIIFKTLAEIYAEKERRKEAARIRRRRKKWDTREWRLSYHGNPYLNVNNFHIVLWFAFRQNTWTVRITDKRTQHVEESRRIYPTVEAAKAGAFDALLYMEQQRR